MMTRAEIIEAIERPLNFPAHAKHDAIAVDVHVLREAVRELRAVDGVAEYRSPAERARSALAIAGGATE